MFNRRQIILTATGALATATLPAQAAPAAPNTKRVHMDLGTLNADHWDRDIPWMKSSHLDHHIVPVRVAGERDIIAQSQTKLVPLDPFNWQCDLFHGNYWKSEREMHGFSTYYDTLDPNKAQNAVNVIDGGHRLVGLTSIWVVGWNPNTIFIACDEVQPTIKTLPRKGALVIKDWRYVARVANLSFYSTPEHIDHMITRALFKLPTISDTHAVYMSSDMHARLLKENPRSIGFKRLRPVDALNHWEKTIGPVPV